MAAGATITGDDLRSLASDLSNQLIIVLYRLIAGAQRASDLGQVNTLGLYSNVSADNDAFWAFISALQLFIDYATYSNPSAGELVEGTGQTLTLAAGDVAFIAHSSDPRLQNLTRGLNQDHGPVIRAVSPARNF